MLNQNTGLFCHSLNIYSFENNPNSQKLGNKINELKTKFDTARSLLTTLPGIDMSYKEQQEYYDSLQTKYTRERELLENYKTICKFDVTELEKGPSESFLNSNDQQMDQPTEEDVPVVPFSATEAIGIDNTDLGDLNQQAPVDPVDPAIKEENNSLMETDNTVAL